MVIKNFMQRIMNPFYSEYLQTTVLDLAFQKPTAKRVCVEIFCGNKCHLINVNINCNIALRF